MTYEQAVARAMLKALPKITGKQRRVFVARGRDSAYALRRLRVRAGLTP